MKIIIVAALLAAVVEAKVCPSPTTTEAPISTESSSVSSASTSAVSSASTSAVSSGSTSTAGSSSTSSSTAVSTTSAAPVTCNPSTGQAKLTFFNAIYNDVASNTRQLCQCEDSTVSLISSGSSVNNIKLRLRANTFSAVVYPEFSCDDPKDFRVILNDGTECTALDNDQFTLAIIPFCAGACQNYGYIVNKTAGVSITCGSQVFDIPRQQKSNQLKFVDTANSNLVGPITGISCKSKPAAPTQCFTVKAPKYNGACAKPKNPLYTNGILTKSWENTETDCACDSANKASQSDYASGKSAIASDNRDSGYAYIAARSACTSTQSVCLCNTKDKVCWEAGKNDEAPELIWLWPYCKGSDCAYNVGLSATNKEAFIQKSGASDKFTVKQSDALYKKSVLGEGLPNGYPLIDSVACDCKTALAVNTCTAIQK
ncbi:unnamed protein product [Bursaphelenchus xylophilus]|uniref:(pine wood nematode) hypothetical protein n=1 Tax=Bursaphelenchus xylophilus TaxID=6326 RepID=A0A1I7S7L6_BURXY|nr:unnamed protein product [Bursaphelenchus xylophilus]CAG9111972.1 unnamed protein product [Bursaphelenchus xylophilus]